MDLTNNKPAIINVSLGHWYPAGAKRLKDSLNYTGFFGDVISWVNELPPNAQSHEENMYNYKLHAFIDAFNKGYTHVLWCDSAMWCIDNTMPIFDYFDENGVYATRSGYNCAQSVNDETLTFAGVSRDEAELIPEYATGCLGLNIKNPISEKILKRWFEYMEAGLFKGSRLHDNQSKDKRFLFHRQEQSCFSLILNELGISIPQTSWVKYFPNNENGVIFFNQGL